MKIILTSDVDNLGSLGEVVTVKPGYGRNFLIPQGMAMLATDANMKVFEANKAKLEAKVNAARAAAKQVAEQLQAHRPVIRVRVGEDDRLYGSVTSNMIVDAYEELGVKVDKRKVVLSDPIRSLGLYELSAKLHPDVLAEFEVLVVSHKWKEGDPIPGDEVEEEMIAEAADSAEIVEPAEDAEMEAAEAEPAAEEADETDTADNAEPTSDQTIPE